tara:strand:- start:51968 stop:52192 length:225 start_codon:yes stop_codon:yes gene_type:complete
MLDGAILACCIHDLKNQQQGISIGRVIKLLLLALHQNLLLQVFFVFFLKVIKGLIRVGRLSSLTFLPFYSLGRS